MIAPAAVVAHYARDDLVPRIEAALRTLGKDHERPTLDDLAPVDEFHSRGREATEEVAAALPPGSGEVLDVGSGLGGPARYLAAKRGRRVVGIDLTPGYVAAAVALTRRCGLAERARFLVADALGLPFAANAFEAAVTLHAAMNIEDKASLYAEVARVLKPGATFVIYDILAGAGGPPRYPMPWSRDGATSFLVGLETLRRLLSAAGFDVVEVRDRGEASTAWFAARSAKPAGQPLGIHLLLGGIAAAAVANLLEGLRNGAVTPTLVRAVRR